MRQIDDACLSRDLLSSASLSRPFTRGVNVLFVERARGMCDVHVRASPLRREAADTNRGGKMTRIIRLENLTNRFPENRPSLDEIEKELSRRSATKRAQHSSLTPKPFHGSPKLCHRHY